MAVADLNFGDLFDALARVIPDRTAIVFGEQERTWRTFDQRSNRLANNLRQRGLGPDAKVAFYLRNSPAYLELLAACFKARLVHCNVNYRYVDRELLQVLDNSDAEAIAYDAEFRPHIEALRAKLPGVRLFLEVGGPAADDNFEQLCSRGNAAPLEIERSGDDLYFMYTGGTTGVPKAVMWPHKARIAVIGMSEAQDAASHARAVADAGSGPIMLPACPLMHSTGFTSSVGALARGGCVVLLPSRQFDPALCLREIERNRVQRLAIVGDAFSVPILQHLREDCRDYDLSSVELITSAGAMWSEPCKLGLLEFFTEATLADSLGSSEGSRIGLSTTVRGQSTRTARFQLGDQVKVFSEDFREVVPGSGEAGLLAKAGPLPLGYYKDAERTASTFPTIDGVRYSMPGDWCIVHDDGSIQLLGRGSSCINSGGEKIFPEEVEEALKTMPGIRDAAVIGVADERWGQAVTAVVVTLDGNPIAETAIRQHLAARIARYKHPKHYHFTTVDLRHANGKMHYAAVARLVQGG